MKLYIVKAKKFCAFMLQVNVTVDNRSRRKNDGFQLKAFGSLFSFFHVEELKVMRILAHVHVTILKPFNIKQYPDLYLSHSPIYLCSFLYLPFFSVYKYRPPEREVFLLQFVHSDQDLAWTPALLAKYSVQLCDAQFIVNLSLRPSLNLYLIAL